MSNRYIDVDSKNLITTNRTTDEIDFYSKVDFTVEFLKTRSCLRLRCLSAQRGAGRRRHVSVFILSRCQLIQGTQISWETGIRRRKSKS